jgi:hypothetical protein
MLGINWREVAMATLMVVFVLGATFADQLIDPFYTRIFQYFVAAVALFMLARWLIERRKKGKAR